MLFNFNLWCCAGKRQHTSNENLHSKRSVCENLLEFFDKNKKNYLFLYIETPTSTAETTVDYIKWSALIEILNASRST